MNESFFLDLDQSRLSNRDLWLATALFYAAVHLTDAVLRDASHNLAGHKNRIDALEKNPAWRPLAVIYNDLKQLSEDARYKCLRPTSQQLREAEKMLARLKAAIVGLL